MKFASPIFFRNSITCIEWISRDVYSILVKPCGFLINSCNLQSGKTFKNAFLNSKIYSLSLFVNPICTFEISIRRIFYDSNYIIHSFCGFNGDSDSFSVGQVISNSDYSGGFVGTLQGSTLNNVYWDTYLSGKTNCYNNVSGIDSNVDCSLTNNADSDYFGESGIPFVSLNFDGNWIDQDYNYPKLSWQD